MRMMHGLRPYSLVHGPKDCLTHAYMHMCSGGLPEDEGMVAGGLSRRPQGPPHRRRERPALPFSMCALPWPLASCPLARRWSLLYVWVRKYESGGRFFTYFFGRMLVCQAVMMVFTACVFISKQAYIQVRRRRRRRHREGGGHLP